MKIERTFLPGVGVRYSTTTAHGEPISIVSHRDGRRELVSYDPAEPDRVDRAIVLDPYEARQIADVLSSTTTVDRDTDLEQQASGLTAVRIPIPMTSPYHGRPLGETRARTRTGASIVAVIRDQQVHIGPGPDFVLSHGDTAVAVGDPEGVDALTEILINDEAVP